MLRNVVSAARRLFIKPRPRVPNPKDSDIYLVSYPKSGNTWMRYLLAYAIWPELEDANLTTLARYVPSFGLEHDFQCLLDPASPCNSLKHRIVKEHIAYTPEQCKHIRRLIYLVRDGRDAIVSYWHFCNQRDGTNWPLSEFIERSARPDHSYGPWHAHVQGWLEAAVDARLVLRYEDLLTDTFGSLRKALVFAEIDVPDSTLHSAIERASFRALKKLESSGGFDLPQLKNVEFVRSGRRNGWQDAFGTGDLERFFSAHGPGFAEFGYHW